jgi:hypothetical protein
VTTQSIKRPPKAAPITQPYAFKAADIARQGIVGLSKLYELIASGEIPARKFGGSTIILASDWQAYLDSLPLVQPKAGGEHA